MTFQSGEPVEIVCDERVVEGIVAFASSNSVSLMLSFDAIIGGHVGLMPVGRGGDGIYRSVMDGSEVTLRKRVEP